jgi:hypothetical protein
MAPSHAQASTSGGWVQGQKLVASDGKAGANFGDCTSISGDTALICAEQDFGGHATWAGAAYIFTRTGTTWTQQQKLNASDGAFNDYFGWVGALDGNTALITAIWDDDNGVDSGSAYVFVRTGTTWTQQAKLTASDGAAGDHFGYSCALNGDTAMIGANWDDDCGDGSGSLYVFTRTGTTWTEQQKMHSSDEQAGDRFSGSIALVNDTALIGAYWDDDNGVDAGSAFVFTRTGTTWSQQQKLLASDGAAGDSFGSSVSVYGDTAFFGAYGDNDNGNLSGSAYVFTRSGTTWTQQQKLLASDGAAGDQFSGGSISVWGDTVLIGAMLDDDNGKDSGSAYIFTRMGTTWAQQQKLLPSDGAANDQFGIVILSGDTAFISSWYDDDMGSNSGSVYVFTKVGTTFIITGGLGVHLKITNNGTTAANGVPYWLHVQGGILGKINKTVNGTIDIPAGGTKTVGTGMLFGFGSLAIAATVAGEDKTATGMQIIVYSMVKK